MVKKIEKRGEVLWRVLKSPVSEIVFEFLIADVPCFIHIQVTECLLQCFPLESDFLKELFQEIMRGQLFLGDLFVLSDWASYLVLEVDVVLRISNRVMSEVESFRGLYAASYPFAKVFVIEKPYFPGVFQFEQSLNV